MSSERWLLAILTVCGIALGVSCRQDTAGGGSAGWETVLTVPAGGGGDITFADTSTAWLVGRGGVFRSGDAGASWEHVSTTEEPLLQVDAAPGGVVGWAVGPGATVMTTSDGGRSWRTVSVPTDIDLNSVAALRDGTVIVGGEGVGQPDQPDEPQPGIVLRSDDAGATWREVSIDGYRPRVIEFSPDGQYGWIAGVTCAPQTTPPQLGCPLQHALFTSSDGGLSWRRTNDGTERTALRLMSPTEGWAYAVECSETDRGVPACNGGVQMTTDGGNTWRTVLVASQYGVPALDALSATSAIVYTRPGCDAICPYALLRTNDRGATWSEMATPPIGDNAAQLEFESDRTGVLVSGGMFYTKDAAATWSPATFPITAGTGDVTFVDGSTGWFSASRLMRTTDGGNSFTPATDAGSGQSFTFVSRDEGWSTDAKCRQPLASNEAQTCALRILRTRDGGDSWQVQYEDTARSTDLALHFADAQRGWAHALNRGLLLRTDDGGETWRELALPQLPDPPRGQLAFGDARTLWLLTEACPSSSIAGCRQRIYRSGDGGETFTLVREDVRSASCSWSFEAVGAERAWITGLSCSREERQLVLWTRDSGVTWGVTWEETASPGQFIRFFNDSDGRAIGASCTGETAADTCTTVIRGTADGGATWTTIASLPALDTGVHQYLFAAPDVLYASVSAGGGVWTSSRQELLRYRLPSAAGAGEGGSRTSMYVALAAGTVAAGAIALRFVRWRRRAVIDTAHT